MLKHFFEVGFHFRGGVSAFSGKWAPLHALRCCLQQRRRFDVSDLGTVRVGVVQKVFQRYRRAILLDDDLPVSAGAVTVVGEPHEVPWWPW